VAEITWCIKPQFKGWVGDGGILVVVNSKDAFSHTGSFSSFLGIHEVGNDSISNVIADGQNSPIHFPNVTIPILGLNDPSCSVIANYALVNATISPFAISKVLGNGTVIYLEMAPLLRSIVGNQNLVDACDWIKDLLQEYTTLESFSSANYRRSFYTKNIGDVHLLGRSTVTTTCAPLGVNKVSKVALSFWNQSDNDLSIHEGITVVGTIFFALYLYTRKKLSEGS